MPSPLHPPLVASLQAELAQCRWLTVPLVVGGAIAHLDEASRAGQAMLARTSLLTLALLADSHCGLTQLLASSLLPRLVGTLTPSASPPYGFAASRLLEVVAQQPGGAATLRESQAAPPLASFALSCLSKRGRGSLCVPALGALGCLLKHPADAEGGVDAATKAAVEPLGAITEVIEVDAREALLGLLDVAGLTGAMLKPLGSADVSGRHESHAGRATLLKPSGLSSGSATPSAKMETTRM